MEIKIIDLANLMRRILKKHVIIGYDKERIGDIKRSYSDK